MSDPITPSKQKDAPSSSRIRIPWQALPLATHVVYSTVCIRCAKTMAERVKCDNDPGTVPHITADTIRVV
ncbi:hypothetical protein VTI74DRAFT_2014 [Chaetomium olivicolor]